MLHRYLSIAVATLVMGMAAPASAAVFLIDGTVAYVDPFSAPPGITAGDAAEIRIDVGGNLTPSSTTGTSATYEYTFANGNDLGLSWFVSVPSAPGAGRAGFGGTVTVTDSPLGDSVEIFLNSVFVSINFSDPTGNALSSTTIPTSPDGLSGFAYLFLDGFDVSGTIVPVNNNTPVPTPGALLMLSLGLLGLGARRRTV